MKGKSGRRLQSLILIATLLAASRLAADSFCYTLKGRTAKEVYAEAYRHLSGGGGWQIEDRLDAEHRFAFQMYGGLNGGEYWRGVTGHLAVRQTKRGALLTITTTRYDPFHPETLGKERGSACAMAVPIVGHFQTRLAVRCNEPCADK
jgi:hypothetical protein